MKFILLLAIVVLTSSYETSASLLRFQNDKNYYRQIARQDDQDKWIEQVLDHFDLTDTRTWQQRYFVNDDYYKEGGPIFLMVSGEQFADPSWLLEKSSLEGYMAKKFGAMLIFLEHRFYGMSRPTTNLSAENLVYLSTYQSLADTAHFIDKMNSMHNIPPSSKWILFGSSYAGSLVAWMRYKYPHLVYAAVANSAPLLAQVDFQDFYVVIDEVLKQHSPSCHDVLTEAFDDVYKQLQNPANYRQLERQFNVCHHFDVNVSSYDVTTFFELILKVPFEMVFDNRINNPTIDLSCKILQDQSIGKPIDRLAKVNELRLKKNDVTCLSTEKYDEIVEALLDQSWEGFGAYERGWIYQTCTEFGWYQSTSGRPFNVPVDAIPIKMYRQLCMDVFGAKYQKFLDLGVLKTNLIYGGQEIVNKTSYTVFVHGTYDPWHAAGVLKSNNPLVPIIIVEGGEHVPLIAPPSDNDSPSKAQAKQDLMKILESWLMNES